MVAASRAAGAVLLAIKAARPDVAAPSRSINVSTARRSAGSPNLAFSTCVRIAGMPGVGFSPRRHLRSSRRVASSSAARSPPRVQSGCFSKASKATGAKPSSTAVTSARSSAAGGVSASGAPAESSISTFQRLSSAATRRASSRSGVTRAAVRPSSFSVSRSARATTSAS